jgi:hypothetical protein
MHEGELALNFANLSRISAANSRLSLRDTHVENKIGCRVQQVDESFHIGVTMHDVRSVQQETADLSV